MGSDAGGPAGVDWAGLRRRLDAAAGPASAGAPEPERVRATLAERARRLARAAPVLAPSRSTEIVTFALGGERWGLEASRVWAVAPLAELARLPGASPPVAGITAWRGSVLPVLDLRESLGISSGRLDDLAFVLVVGTERPAFGVLADRVHELMAADPGALGPPPDGVAPRRDLLLGVTRSSLPVLDARKLVERYG